MTVANAIPRLNQAPKPLRVLVTDTVRLPDPLPAMAVLPRGSMVILRHYGEKTKALLARRMVGLARRRGLVLLVAGDWRLAATIGADGLHLPEGLARHGILAPALGWVRRRCRLLSVACHGVPALTQALRLKADVALLSPVFPTASHPGAVPMGPVRFGFWARRSRLPVIALGGMTACNLARLPRGSARGWAAIGAFIGS